MKTYINTKFKVTFTPHLAPMFRGILSTIYIDLKNNITQNRIIKELRKFYRNKKFVKIMNKDKLLSTNDVINTNYCYISVCKTKYKNKLILLSVIDNLIKGGAGQAIQNMNQKFEFKENEGFK
jgi:N-acetyl-gamma-glutamyl-phosphate reductase